MHPIASFRLVKARADGNSNALYSSSEMIVADLTNVQFLNPETANVVRLDDCETSRRVSSKAPRCANQSIFNRHGIPSHDGAKNSDIEYVYKQRFSWVYEGQQHEYLKRWFKDDGARACAIVLYFNTERKHGLSNFYSDLKRHRLLGCALSTWYWSASDKNNLPPEVIGLPDNVEDAVTRLFGVQNTSAIFNTTRYFVTEDNAVSFLCVPSDDLRKMVPRVGIETLSKNGAEAVAKYACYGTPELVSSILNQSIKASHSVLDILDTWSGVGSNVCQSFAAYTRPLRQVKVYVPFSLVSATKRLAGIVSPLFAQHAQVEMDLRTYFNSPSFWPRQDEATTRMLFPCNALPSYGCDTMPAVEMEILSSYLSVRDDARTRLDKFVESIFRSLLLPLCTRVTKKLVDEIHDTAKDLKRQKKYSYPKPLFEALAVPCSGAVTGCSEFLSACESSRPFYAARSNDILVPLYALYTHLASFQRFVAPMYVPLPSDGIRRVSDQVTSHPEIVWPSVLIAIKIKDVVREIPPGETYGGHSNLILVPDSKSEDVRDDIREAGPFAICYYRDVFLDVGLCNRMALFVAACAPTLSSKVSEKCGKYKEKVASEIKRPDLAPQLLDAAIHSGASMRRKMIGGDPQSWTLREAADMSMTRAAQRAYGSIQPGQRADRHQNPYVFHRYMNEMCGSLLVVRVERPDMQERPHNVHVVDNVEYLTLRTSTATLRLISAACRQISTCSALIFNLRDNDWVHYGIEGQKRMTNANAIAFIQKYATVLIYERVTPPQ